MQKSKKLTHAKRKRIRHFYALAFARVLKELRARFNLSPAQAAARAKMTKTKWLRRERGLVSPRMDEVLSIAAQFKIQRLWIFKRLIDYREEEERKAGTRRR